MDNKKYEITDIEHDTIKGLFRIRRLSDWLLGGFVSGYHNLSQDGECFIYDDACVYDKAEVSDDAMVTGNSTVTGDATISGNAKVTGDDIVKGFSYITGYATISGDVCGGTEIW